jgi:hypothetical protein
MIQVARLTTSDQSVAPGYSRRFILIFGVPAMVANDSADRTAAQAPGCTPGRAIPGRTAAAPGPRRSNSMMPLGLPWRPGPLTSCHARYNFGIPGGRGSEARLMLARRVEPGPGAPGHSSQPEPKCYFCQCITRCEYAGMLLSFHSRLLFELP